LIGGSAVAGGAAPPPPFGFVPLPPLFAAVGEAAEEGVGVLGGVGASAVALAGASPLPLEGALAAGGFARVLGGANAMRIGSLLVPTAGVTSAPIPVPSASIDITAIPAAVDAIGGRPPRHGRQAPLVSAAAPAAAAELATGGSAGERPAAICTATAAGSAARRAPHSTQ
jgi:hypothetical protein